MGMKDECVGLDRLDGDSAVHVAGKASPRAKCRCYAGPFGRLALNTVPLQDGWLVNAKGKGECV